MPGGHRLGLSRPRPAPADDTRQIDAHDATVLQQVLDGVVAVLGRWRRPEVEIPAGPLLLIDARYRSGWSVTVAAALLREGGATAVLPLVLHQLP